jgi:uncharacterized damage-inducible protein DinB
MRAFSHSLPAAALVLVCAAAVLPAQGAATSGAPTAGSQSASGLRKELIQELESAEKKMVALAEATPQEKYGWRPAPGVRSVSEVFMHVVGANFMIPGMAGVKRDKGVTLSRDMEKSVTDKAQVVDMLRKSFAYAKQAMTDVPDGEMDAQVSLFGQPSTKRGVLVVIATHAHEHVGQSIAYARVNGITPPWSQGANGDQ